MSAPAGGGWAWPGELRRRGVLGINGRNLRLLAEFNPRAFYPEVDDKLLTKLICADQGIAVPETYAAIDRFGDIRRFDALIGGRSEFVVKPARGSGGRGVTVIVARTAGGYRTVGGEEIPAADLRYHLSITLAGLYSLGGRPDRAIVERRIRTHAAFEGLAIDGTPDVRVILHRGVPVMAMLRMPTRASRGRANLHQGAVGAGIDLITGCTCGGVCRDRAVAAHPDSGRAIAGTLVPAWPAVIEAALALGERLHLGYVGVDVVLDANLGPVVLEANARPGLAVQIANGCGLLKRIAFVDAHHADGASRADRLRLARDAARIR